MQDADSRLPCVGFQWVKKRRGGAGRMDGEVASKADRDLARILQGGLQGLPDAVRGVHDPGLEKKGGRLGRRRVVFATDDGRQDDAAEEEEQRQEGAGFRDRGWRDIDERAGGAAEGLGDDFAVNLAGVQTDRTDGIQDGPFDERAVPATGGLQVVAIPGEVVNDIASSETAGNEQAGPAGAIDGDTTRTGDIDDEGAAHRSAENQGGVIEVGQQRDIGDVEHVIANGRLRDRGVGGRVQGSERERRREGGKVFRSGLRGAPGGIQLSCAGGRGDGRFLGKAAGIRKARAEENRGGGLQIGFAAAALSPISLDDANRAAGER